jgi:hypothetical protein
MLPLRFQPRRQGLDLAGALMEVVDWAAKDQIRLGNIATALAGIRDAF